MAALQNRYHPQAKIDLYQMQFSERKQKKNESLSDLGENIKKLIRKAYPMMNQPSCQLALDQMARNRFVDAIFSDELKNEVRLWRKPTLDETLTEAIRLEGALNIKKTEQRASRLLQSNYAMDQPDVQFSNQQPHGFSFQSGNGQQQNRYGSKWGGPDSRQTGNSQGSRGRGHSSTWQGGRGQQKNANRDRGQSQNSAQQTGYTKAENRICHDCGEQGHLRYNCPRLQQNLN